MTKSLGFFKLSKIIFIVDTAYNVSHYVFLCFESVVAFLIKELTTEYWASLNKNEDFSALKTSTMNTCLLFLQSKWDLNR